uniref:Uncharacterized protein n=1 Tax=Molossus molossus TaxID=27622 RepID=A0A7J8BYK9_MOLMO|nr:hypothetical protein HJG59_010086 [Molossus molossus]
MKIRLGERKGNFFYIECWLGVCVCVCVCVWNFIFVKFLSNYVAEFTFISQTLGSTDHLGVANLKMLFCISEQRCAALRNGGCGGLGGTEVLYVSIVSILQCKGVAAAVSSQGPSAASPRPGRPPAAAAEPFPRFGSSCAGSLSSVVSSGDCIRACSGAGHPCGLGNQPQQPQWPCPPGSGLRRPEHGPSAPRREACFHQLYSTLQCSLKLDLHPEQ